MENEARKELFEKWRLLGNRIASLGGIVQNDVAIPESQIKEWAELARELEEEYKFLVREMPSYLDARLTETLKPCPFCGNDDAFLYRDSGLRYVCCGECGASASYSETNEEAVAAWNERVETKACREGSVGKLLNLTEHY